MQHWNVALQNREKDRNSDFGVTLRDTVFLKGVSTCQSFTLSLFGHSVIKKNPNNQTPPPAPPNPKQFSPAQVILEKYL